jgi:hypothetical protein
MSNKENSKDKKCQYVKKKIINDVNTGIHYNAIQFKYNLKTKSNISQKCQLENNIWQRSIIIGLNNIWITIEQLHLVEKHLKNYTDKY